MKHNIVVRATLGIQVLNTSKKLVTTENETKYLAPVLDTSNQEPKKRNGNNTVTKYNILKAPVLNTGEYKMDINTITKEIKKYDLLQAIFCFKEILIQLDGCLFLIRNKHVLAKTGMCVPLFPQLYFTVPKIFIMDESSKKWYIAK